jgi:hypothetical protein
MKDKDTPALAKRQQVCRSLQMAKGMPFSRDLIIYLL